MGCLLWISGASLSILLLYSGAFTDNYHPSQMLRLAFRYCIFELGFALSDWAGTTGVRTLLARAYWLAVVEFMPSVYQQSGPQSPVIQPELVTKVKEFLRATVCGSRQDGPQF